MALELSDLLTLREAANLIGVDSGTIWGLIEEEAIPGYRITGRWFVSKTELLDCPDGLLLEPA